MSLRNALRQATELHVASPRACNTQLSGGIDATVDATAVQQQPANPHECLISGATRGATSMQHLRLQVCNSSPANPSRMQRSALTAHRVYPALVFSINRCCDARGDELSNRAALIAECVELEPEAQSELRDYFEHEAARWEAAICGRDTSARARTTHSAPDAIFDRARNLQDD